MKTTIDISKRTKGEWIVSHFLHESSIYSPTEKKGIAKLIYSNLGYSEEEIEANAAFIVLAANNHDKLVEALQIITQRFELEKMGYNEPLMVDAAIHKAKQLLESIQKDTQ